MSTFGHLLHYDSDREHHRSMMMSRDKRKRKVEMMRRVHEKIKEAKARKLEGKKKTPSKSGSMYRYKANSSGHTLGTNGIQWMQSDGWSGMAKRSGKP